VDGAAEIAPSPKRLNCADQRIPDRLRQVAQRRFLESTPGSPGRVRLARKVRRKTDRGRSIAAWRVTPLSGLMLVFVDASPGRCPGLMGCCAGGAADRRGLLHVFQPHFLAITIRLNLSDPPRRIQHPSVSFTTAGQWTRNPRRAGRSRNLLASSPAPKAQRLLSPGQRPGTGVWTFSGLDFIAPFIAHFIDLRRTARRGKDVLPGQIEGVR
jgi:hypothetical protein